MCQKNRRSDCFSLQFFVKCRPLLDIVTSILCFYQNRLLCQRKNRVSSIQNQQRLCSSLLWLLSQVSVLLQFELFQYKFGFVISDHASDLLLHCFRHLCFVFFCFLFFFISTMSTAKDLKSTDLTRSSSYLILFVFPFQRSSHFFLSLIISTADVV